MRGTARLDKDSLDITAIEPSQPVTELIRAARPTMVTFTGSSLTWHLSPAFSRQAMLIAQSTVVLDPEECS